MFGSELKQLIVLDDIRDKLEMIDSDIIPESCSHPVVTGIENVPTSIRSAYGTSYEGAYTTFPLSPLQGRVHHIKDSFLNFVIDVNFAIYVATKLDKDVTLFVGPRDTASIFNQVQLMIDNNPIWTTTYQHIESAIDMAGLPASVVDHSPNYATIDKLLANKQTPMQKIVIPASDYASASGDARYLKYKLKFDFNIDLNRLSVPLSNIAYITSNMGNLRLRVYLNNFHQSFYVFQLPQTSLVPGTAGQETSKAFFNQYQHISSLVAIRPVPWGTASVSGTTVTFSNPVMLQLPFNEKVKEASAGNTWEMTTLATAYNTPQAALFPVQFVFRPASQTADFMSVELAQICQTCFDLKQDSWDTLCEYFKQTGKVIIPIQAWATALFNNGTIEGGSGQFQPTLLANVPGNNITAIAVTAACVNAQSCLVNPYRSQFQGILDGKPLNAIPYDKVDGRAIQDFTNACVDTDCEEINTDYLYSLQFPQFIATGKNNMDRHRYFWSADAEGDSGSIKDFTYFAQQGFNGGISSQHLQKNPNLFMYMFQTAIPDSFHTGMCIIENSNRQALFRFTSTAGEGDIAKFKQRFYGVDGLQLNTSNNTFTIDSNPIYINMPNYSNQSIQMNISCLCDECIVLDYDSANNTCSGGYLSYAKPFVVD